jgi:hypothetical protein
MFEIEKNSALFIAVCKIFASDRYQEKLDDRFIIIS